MPTVEALDPSQASQVCEFLAPLDNARVTVASKSTAVARVAQSDSVWAAQVRNIFGPQESCAGEGADAIRTTFAGWNAAAKECGLPAPAAGARDMPQPRWISVWARLRRWAKAHAPEVASTLRPGLQKDQEDLLAASGFTNVAQEVLDMWRVFDGQEAPLNPGLAQQLGLPVCQDHTPRGLFGGYAAYEHEVSTSLLPLKAALALTRFVQEQIPPLKEKYSNCLAFACSTSVNKMLFVDVVTGEVTAWTRNQHRLLEPAAPSGGFAADGLLRWMEEYANRLENGVYTVRPIVPEMAEETTGISLVPVSGEDVTRCVTRGVEVVAGWVYMPEHPAGWTYSISLKLVEDQETRGYETCQLVSRHWQINADGEETEHVRGEGVIGLFPILTDGGWLVGRESDPHGNYGRRMGSALKLLEGEFRYQSCSGRRSPGTKVHFGGDFHFIPGTRKKPTGPPFTVRVETFTLYVPDYIF